MNKVFYKYATIECATHIVRTNRVILSSTDRFNDAHEARYYWEDESSDCQELLRAYCLEEYCFSKGLFPENRKRRERYDASSLVEYEPDVVLNGRMSQMLVNDLQAQEDVNEAVEEKKRQFVEAIKTEIQSYGISCFSHLGDSPLMWAHYGDNNRGACIRFEGEYPDIRDVQYKEQLPEVSFASILKMWLASGQIVDRNELFRSILCTKGKDWSYEAECRLLTGNPVALSEGKWDMLSDGRITAVYLGYKADLDTAASLRSICCQLGIPVYKMNLSPRDAKFVCGDKLPPVQETVLTEIPRSLLYLKRDIESATDRHQYVGAFLLSLMAPAICSGVSRRIGKEETYSSWFSKYVQEELVSKNRLAYGRVILDQNKIVEEHLANIFADIYESITCKGTSQLKKSYSSLTITSATMMQVFPEYPLVLIPPKVLENGSFSSNPDASGTLRINSIAFSETIRNGLSRFCEDNSKMLAECDLFPIENIVREKEMCELLDSYKRYRLSWQKADN